MNQTPSTIGQRIRDLRQRLRMTQTALAGEYGTSQSAISAIEIGDTQPGIDFLVWFAERTGASIEYLVSGKEQSPAEGARHPSRAYLRALVAEVLTELRESQDTAENRIGESTSGYALANTPLTEREQRLLTALRRLDGDRQERIVTFAEDLAAACHAGQMKK